MSECKLCHTPLTALNMSDIEPDTCQMCVNKIIDQLEPLEVDEELKGLTDEDLDTISKTLFPTPMYLTKKMVQRRSPHSNSNGWWTR